MKYRPEIDGLRAVAVIPVIFFHAGFETFSGGYVGVDIFFVISGYLITSIIVNDLEDGSFSIAHFYERRAKRILPALFLVSLLCVPVAWALLDDEAFAEFARSLAAVAIFASNFHFWGETGYFATAQELKPLLHTWSLAVEEQYYIIYPVLLLLLWRAGKQIVQFALILLFFGSLAAAQFGVERYPVAVFYLLPFRAWELMLGAFCAFYLRRREREPNALLSNALCILGAVAIMLSIVMFNHHTPTPSLWTLFPTLGAALLITCAHAGTALHKILASPSLVKIGLISYSAYLWHQPLFAFARAASLEAPATPLMLGLSAASLALAWLTWRFVETPFRTDNVNRTRTLRLACAAATIVFAIGATGMTIAGAVGSGWANPRLSVNTGVIANYEDRKEEQAYESWELLREITDDPMYFLVDNAPDREPWFDANDDRANLLVVGNSHSKDLFSLLWYSKGVQRHFELARFGAQIGALKKGHAFFDTPNYRDAHVVMLSSRFIPQRGDVSILESLIERMLDDGKQVAIVKPVYEFPESFGGAWVLFDRVYHEVRAEGVTDPRIILEASNKRHYDVYKTVEPLARISDANDEIDRLSALYPELIVLDRADLLCSEEEEVCFSANENLENYFYGNGHITVTGAKFFAKRIDEIGWLNSLYASIAR